MPQAKTRTPVMWVFPLLLACEVEPPKAESVNDGSASATSSATNSTQGPTSSAPPAATPTATSLGGTPSPNVQPPSTSAPLPTVLGSPSASAPSATVTVTAPSTSATDLPCPSTGDGTCDATAPCPDPDCAASAGGAPPLPSTAAGGSSALGGAEATGVGGASGDNSAGVGGQGGATTSGGCPAAALFCDDFEAAAMLSASWLTRVNGDGTVAIDETIAAHSGTRSVRVNATGYQTFFALSGAPVFPVPGGSLYVRVFIRLREAMTAGHNTYFEAGPSDSTDAQYETRVGVQQQQLMINQPAGDRGFLANQNYYIDNVIGAHLTEEMWGCVEVFFDPANSTIRMWLDDAEIPDLARTDWQQDEIAELRFGYEKYAGPNTEIWFDDIVVASEPIGCN